MTFDKINIQPGKETKTLSLCIGAFIKSYSLRQIKKKDHLKVEACLCAVYETCDVNTPPWLSFARWECHAQEPFKEVLTLSTFRCA